MLLEVRCIFAHDANDLHTSQEVPELVLSSTSPLVPSTDSPLVASWKTLLFSGRPPYTPDLRTILENVSCVGLELRSFFPRGNYRVPSHNLSRLIGNRFPSEDNRSFHSAGTEMLF